jgi:hypothetical protein
MEDKKRVWCIFCGKKLEGNNSLCCSLNCLFAYNLVHRWVVKKLDKYTGRIKKIIIISEKGKYTYETNNKS